MPGGVYNFQGRASFIDILDWDRGRVGSVAPPRQPVSPILSSHGWTDVILMKGALRGWSGGGLMHTQCSTVHNGTLVAAPQCQPTNSDSWSMSAPPAPQPPFQSSSRGSTMNCAPGTAPARHQAPSSARLTGAVRLTTQWSFLNDADHQASRPPHPATQASLPDTGEWTVTRNCPISQVYTPMALHSPPSVSC